MFDEPHKNAKVDRATLRRAWSFARPYKRDITWYLVLAFVTAVLGVLPALVFRRLIDDAIPKHNRTEINVLALIVVGIAMSSAILGVGIRWLGARVGEGLIADTRAPDTGYPRPRLPRSPLPTTQPPYGFIPASFPTF